MEENLTTKRIGAHLLAHTSVVITDKVFYKRKVWSRVSQYFIDFNYPLRRIISSYAEQILKLIIDLIKQGSSTGLNIHDLQENKLYIL